ncbi:flap endonuclease 1 [Metallosphaera sedula]|uniref:Flap endonuclease 1 n=3 Tax=Metallosphaera TaxID=41980 RepID=A4YD87_METS5|nr:flap endonuclease 1 [Metallosphaera sedula DSM 5348]AIM26376.1 flap endonuclease 1 [Metallosphaera sedula]AKV73382.1 flap endonuclease-1 [Metallosphaera sedula]AKV75626.1 flap endonuclease-1 [Metallosphaera sedula]AKV77872.1 flap endonuclease-1 [Metallosphaera sedula]
MNRQGKVTSHLNGVFYRTVNLLEEGIIPIYVFDGKPPELKAQELENRRKMKEEAEKKLEKAKESGKVEEMRKYSQMTSRLTTDMAKESKELLEYMGVPTVQAPSEGEAEAAYLNAKGITYASASQDYDSLLFGAEKLIRNLTISGKRKLPNKDVYVEVKPELIETASLLKKLEITREQLIDIAILVGTDYNPDGVRGIGPKKAYKLIKTYKKIENIDKRELPEPIYFDYEKIRELFLKPQVTLPSTPLELSDPDPSKIIQFLVNENDFNEERVRGTIERLQKAMKEIKDIKRQTGLDQWF